MGERVLVKPISERRTGSGLIIPLANDERPTEGVVKYIGNKVVDISVGDYVYYPAYINQTITLNDEELMMMMESDILAVKE